MPEKKEAMMAPKVGGRHFAYTKAGAKAAKVEAKRTGKPVERKKKVKR